MTDTTGIVERLLELSFVSEGVARSRDEMGWDSVSYHRKRAESMKEAADTIERQQKEIERLTSERDAARHSNELLTLAVRTTEKSLHEEIARGIAARNRAIEECAKVADDFSTNAREHEAMPQALAFKLLAKAIRALGGQK
jgi:hypothetical protein